MNLTKKLAGWQQQNLITASQAEAILAYEQKCRKPMFMYSFLALAVFCIGLGIISLISANWQLIPGGVKLFFDFVFLIVLAVAAYRFARNEKTLWFETAIVLYAVMILASIGLIAQIYQIQPDGYKAYFVWSLLTAPLLFYTQKLVLPIVWFPVFTASTIDLLTHISWIDRILGIVERSFPFAISITGILVLSFVYRLLAIHFRTRLAAVVKALKFWLVFDIVVLVLMMDFGAGNPFVSGMFGRMHSAGSYVSSIVISLLVVTVAGFGYFSHKYNYSRLLTCILAILLGFSFIYTSLPHNTDVLDIWGFLLSMSALSCLCAYALIKGRHKLLNLATGLMALRFFIVYIQVFGSLLTTGIGLIVSGFVFLGIICLWKRLHIEKFIDVREPK